MTDGPGARTMFEENERAGLNSICKGHIPEMFQREFERALENAMDVNTPFKKKREVTLKVTITTTEDRSSFHVEAVTSSKLAPFIGESGIVFAAKRGSEILAVTYDVEQMQLPLSGPTAAVKGTTKAPEAAQKGTGTNG